MTMQRFERFPMQRPVTPLLDRIEAPDALQALSITQLNQLADELRAYLLYHVGRQGGHLGAGLGVVELTIALHRYYSAPEDRIVWDVGHQAYPHKILTGRREALGSIRQWGGLAPFPSRQESPHDAFGVGHAGTAVSAALGIALSRRVLNQPGRACAIVGDGALSCGMTFEALSHAGGEHADLTVILNDNGMSISPNVGAVAEHLASAFHYGNLHLPDDESTSVATTAAFFRMMGFDYSGPIDGHDIEAILAALENQEAPSGPRLLHVVTQKGAGFTPAEEDTLAGHSHSPSTPTKGSHDFPKYQDVFGQWICERASQDPRLVAITPAMSEGSGLVPFSTRFPQRFFDVAIAEQHALTLAAGMATAGTKPLVAIYSTFLQRGYDQLIHDIALQELDVTLAVDRAGLVGEDGPTHHGAFDISYLRAIPNLVVMTPSEPQSFGQALDLAYHYAGPCAVRYPRGQAIPLENGQVPEFRWGEGAWLCKRQSAMALLNFGGLLPEVIEAAARLGASVIDMRFVKPLDVRLLHEAVSQHVILITVEDNVTSGGAGGAVAEALCSAQADPAVKRTHVPPQLIRLGLPDVFVSHGSRETLLEQVGLTADGIVRQVRDYLAHNHTLAEH
ncbi:1-deoxy-D-xylulose-5-phosphate synthase [Halomonadaceae bacterium LMG 33818]